jgi:hypothetical protein
MCGGTITPISSNFLASVIVLEVQAIATPSPGSCRFLKQCLRGILLPLCPPLSSRWLLDSTIDDDTTTGDSESCRHLYNAKMTCELSCHSHALGLRRQLAGFCETL